MKVLVAGGTGAIGRWLVPQLEATGHHVIVLAKEVRSGIRRAGSSAEVSTEFISCDVFNESQVERVLEKQCPDAVIDELTSLPAALKPKELGAVYERNNEIRWLGGGNLLRAAINAGVGRIVIQSAAYWYAPGVDVRPEDSPLYVDAPEPIGAAVRTISRVERRAFESGLDPVILRYGMFYGPGTWYSPTGDVGAQLKRRKFPIIGQGRGVFSLVHIDDAATATVKALTAPAGIYNIVDSDPARLSEWLPAFAESIGAPKPMRVPLWVARIAAGRAMTTWMDRSVGADNRRAQNDMGWAPRFSSWHEGFCHGLTDAADGHQPTKRLHLAHLRPCTCDRPSY